MENRKTILATAYAINPFKGSEDGMGWNFVLQIARFNNAIVITRENNKQNIDRYIELNPDKVYNQITFLYFDLPYWMRFWKKGGRGAMLYFWMWQKSIPSFIKKKRLIFDIVHNLNFHNDWTPSFLWKLNKPFVWGPIGHHPPIPVNFLKPYSKTYWLKERATLMVKKIFWRLSLSLHKTILHADHILCMNSEVANVINLKFKSYSIMPSVATENHEYGNKTETSKFSLLSVGRLVPLKGFDLTLLSFASFVNGLPAVSRENCELIIVGSGPEKKRLTEMVVRNKIEKYVHFIEWMDRSELFALYRTSSAFLFPSHEGAGMVVAEALSFGLPVICLDNSGPGEFINGHCGMAIKAETIQEAVDGLAQSILQMYKDPAKLQELSLGARKHFELNFDWKRRGEKLKLIYSTLL